MLKRLGVSLWLLTLFGALNAFAAGGEVDLDGKGGDRSDRATHYALACIRTATTFAVNYQVKWGDGEWQNAQVQPNRWNSHYWRYSTQNENKSPKLTIRFDSQLSGATFWQQYNVPKYATVDVNCNVEGKQYSFVYDHGKNFIDLVSTN